MLDAAYQLRPLLGRAVADWYGNLAADGRLDTLPAYARREIAERYLPALAELAVRHIEQPSEPLAAIYRDELQRYELELQPGKSSPFTTDELIAAQLAAFGNLPSPVSRTVTAALNRLSEPLRSVPRAQYDVLLLGDCLMNEIRCFLADRARQHGVRLRGYHLYFSGALSTPFDLSAAHDFARRHTLRLIGFSPFTFDALPVYRQFLLNASGDARARSQVRQIVEIVGETVREIRSFSDAPVLVHTGCGAPIGRSRTLLTSLPPLTGARRAALAVLNAELRRHAAAWDTVVVVDEESLAGRPGLRALSAPAVPGAAIPDGLFHTSRLGRELAGQYWDVIQAARVLGERRVLAVDFDGTLWSGVMAEGAVRHFTARQAALKQLAGLGTLLVGLSKGSPTTLRWRELVLGQPDFALVQRSWQPKPAALQQAMNDLGVRPEQVAVIDDSPAERAMLRAAFPDVLTLDAGDPVTWRWVGLLCQMQAGTVTEDARLRTVRYQTGQARQRFVTQAGNHGQQLAKLGLTLTFRRMRDGDASRLLELLGRTNQFNTTGFRPSRAELLELASDGHAVFVAEMDDRLGDFGLIAAAIVRQPANSVEAFVMSCRAMGYGAEHVVLDRLIAECGLPMTAPLVRTRLNEPCHGLYAAAGFAEKAPGLWTLQERRPGWLPPWITVRGGPEGEPGRQHQSGPLPGGKHGGDRGSAFR